MPSALEWYYPTTSLVWKKHASLAPSSLSQVKNCEQYLQHCHTNNVSFTSTVFRGTLYEYASKAFLEDKLKCFDLVRKGGAFDNGIDLVGKWDLSHFFKLNETDIKAAKVLRSRAKVIPIITNSKELHELKNTKSTKKNISIKHDINILVQCKNHRTKIKASILRELVGIYSQYIKNDDDKNSTFMVLMSPSPLSKQAHSIIDQTSIPLIHIILSPLELSSHDTSIDNSVIDSWDGGVVQSIYLNSYSKILLKYLNIELEFQKLKSYIMLS
ncbi:Required for respiratory growth protein 7, mitochondrial [Yamadazyma tenuis]|nr:Required for respiratory growth protein 7, mitochondrial [Yamadazyma tenuis]